MCKAMDWGHHKYLGQAHGQEGHGLGEGSTFRLTALLLYLVTVAEPA